MQFGDSMIREDELHMLECVCVWGFVCTVCRMLGMINGPGKVWWILVGLACGCAHGDVSDMWRYVLRWVERIFIPADFPG